MKCSNLNHPSLDRRLPPNHLPCDCRARRRPRRRGVTRCSRAPNSNLKGAGEYSRYDELEGGGSYQRGWRCKAKSRRGVAGPCVSNSDEAFGSATSSIPPREVPAPHDMICPVSFTSPRGPDDVVCKNRPQQQYCSLER